MTDPTYSLQPIDSGVIESETTCNELEFKRSLVTGELADRVRERFGITEELPVYFLEYQEEYGGCPTCYGTDNMLTVECGDQKARFTANDGLPLNKLLHWFDQPRREREQAEAKAAREQAAREKDALFTRGLVDSLHGAMEAVETEGYSSDQEWHDKVMGRLGIKGYE
jgi:hypothetical protein